MTDLRRAGGLCCLCAFFMLPGSLIVPNILHYVRNNHTVKEDAEIFFFEGQNYTSSFMVY